MRPTKRAVVLFAASIPIALILVSFLPEWWFVSLYLPILILAFMVADMSMSLSQWELANEVEVPPRLFIGGKGTAVVRLQTERLVQPFEVTALLEIVGDAEIPQPVSATMSESAVVLKLPIVPLRRGHLSVKALWLRWSGPFGLMETYCRRPVRTTMDVVPNVRGIYEEALQFFDRDAVFGSKSQRRRGEGTEFDKLIEYESGMDNRFIDWKRSARHRKLLSREFCEERNHQVILGFDTGHLMLEPIDGVPRMDHAVRAGMVLGWTSLRHGDLVGGCGFDAGFRSFLQPGRGMAYFTRIQHFAAGLNYRTEETNYTLGLAELASRLRRRALVVLFSEFIDSISAELLVENLQLMSKRHVVVFVTFKDPLLQRLRDGVPGTFDNIAKAVIADDFQRERSAVLGRMERAGVHCLETTVRDLSSSLLNRYIMIKQKGLL